MKESIVYKNGEYILESDTSISFRNTALQRGFGVFDYLRTYRQKPFQLDWHAHKLVNSMSGLAIQNTLSLADFMKIVETIFVKNKVYMEPDFEYSVKTMVGGGEDPFILVYMEKLDLEPYITMRNDGISLLVHGGKRLYPAIKSLDYRADYIHKKELSKKNSLEILYVDNDIVYEAATSNVFMVKDNVIYTPKTGIYAGSTREYVMNFAIEYGYKVNEQEISWDMFVDADEVFITASKKEILPVVQIYRDADEVLFQIGPVIKNLINIFQDKKNNL